MDSWYLKTGWIPSIFAAVGNGIVIYLLVTRRKLFTTSNRFVLSLAVADLCVGLCYYPGHVTCHLMALNSCNYKIRDDIAVTAIFSSVTNLCAMTLDRYIAVIKPLHYMSVMTARRASILAAGAWLLPLVVYFIPSFCASLGLFRLNMQVTIIVWTTMFEFIPCLFLLITTVRLVSIARRHYQKDTHVRLQLSFNQPNQTHFKRSFTSTKVIVSVVVIFFLCYAVEIYSSFCYFTHLCPRTMHVFNTVRLLVITNSAANPIAYALFKHDIKEELRKTFGGLKRRSDRRNTREITDTTGV